MAPRGREPQLVSGEYRPPESAVAYAVGGTAFVVLVAAVAVFNFARKSRLNWYERNLLDISASQKRAKQSEGQQAQRVKCRQLGRTDTLDSTLDELPAKTEDLNVASGIASAGLLVSAPLPDQLRKQSRIFEDKQETPKSARKLSYSGALRVPMSREPSADVSEMFTIPTRPRAHSHSYQQPSMFRELSSDQIQRDLYEKFRDDSASAEEPMTGQCGSLKLALHLDPALSLLTVQLRSATDLMALRADGPPNPYFRVTLAKPGPSGHRHTQQTKIYRNTRSPEMNDEFCFDVPSSDLLGECKLEVLVYDFDQCSTDECIGYCWLSLNRIEVSTTSERPTVFWAEVLPISLNEGGYGEVLLSLAYLSKAQRLTISIFKARNIVAADEMVEQPASSARVTVFCAEKKLKRKRTATKKGTSHPVFNEVLHFNIPKNSLVDISLDLEVVHESGAFGMTNRVLGRLYLPLSQCKNLWRAIIHGESCEVKWYPLEKP